MILSLIFVVVGIALVITGILLIGKLILMGLVAMVAIGFVIKLIKKLTNKDGTVVS
jgi:hypothetical protein